MDEAGWWASAAVVNAAALDEVSEDESADDDVEPVVAMPRRSARRVELAGRGVSEAAAQRGGESGDSGEEECRVGAGPGRGDQQGQDGVVERT